MADAEALWSLLLQAAEPRSAAALKHEVETAPDKALVRVNGDRLKIGGQAVIAIAGDKSVVGWNRRP